VDVTVRASEDLDHVRSVIGDVAETISKEEPWNERLWGPIEILGLDSVLLDSMVVRVSAKTMPGKAMSVERELRWRIKRAFDAADIRIVGGPTAPVDEEPLDPTSAVAAPSALGNPASPQSEATAPIPAPGSVPAPSGAPK
jgi:small conductance mechanosensitive channel